jgi:anti-sigma B factor antagonist
MTDQRGGPLQVDLDAAGVLVVHGDIDVAGGPTLEACVLTRENEAPIVLDLGDVDFIDSSGLRTLLGASRRAGERGTAVHLRNVGSAVRRMLDITGTTEQFRLED